MSQWLLAIYAEHRRGLFSHALSITQCGADAEDAVQNAIASLVARNRPRGDAVAYVFRCVRNAALDLRRGNRRELEVVESLYVQCHARGFHEQDDSLNEYSAILRRAVDELDDRSREAIVLKVYAGLTFRQIEQVTGESASTVATRYRRALSKLRERLRGRV
ncbi:MAG: sigma-70 family RNA polymerase sigma factor [Planctomycetota bacterium]